MDRDYGESTIFEKLVFMIPGAMQFMRILSHARSSAVALQSPTKAVLLIEYTPTTYREREREIEGKKRMVDLMKFLVESIF